MLLIALPMVYHTRVYVYCNTRVHVYVLEYVYSQVCHRARMTCEIHSNSDNNIYLGWNYAHALPTLGYSIVIA